MSQNINVDSLIKIKNKSGGYDTIYPITKAENVRISANQSLAQKLREVENALGTKLSSETINQPNGLAGLDENGLIPVGLIPSEFKEIHVVENIGERDAMTDLFKGLSVYVKDAIDDETVNRGGAYYIYDGNGWVKTAEAESLDVILDFNSIQNKPTTLEGYGITDGVNSSDVTEVAEANKLLKLDADGELAANVKGNASTATKLETAVNVNISGDINEVQTTFDGTQDLVIPFVLKDTGVTAGTYVKVQVNSKGQVIGADVLRPEDIPNLDWSKITTGKPTTLAGYGIEDALNLAGGELTGHLTLHADPTEDLHAATKHYVDSVVQGLDVKESVRVATTENLPELSGLLIVDSVQLVEGNRVLVKNQSDKRQNGIYIAQTGAWTRALDANVSKSITPGLFTFVEEGTVNSNAGFVLTTNGAIVLGVTELEFTQFSGAGQIITGVGLSKNGNSIYLSNTGVTAGTYTKVTVDEQGRVTQATGLSVSDLPELTWDLITGRPISSVEDIDDAVNKKHNHDNIETINALTHTDERLKFKEKDIAFKDEIILTAVSTEAPTSLSIGGLWFQTI